MTTSEPKRTYIGTIDTTGVGAIALPINIDAADPTAIQAAIKAAEAAKQEETRRLREIVGLEKEPPK
jgi:hypothetical protein